MKKIFLYTTDESKRKAIEKLCKDQDFILCGIGFKDINRTVSEICGMPVKLNKEHKKAPAMYMLPELMLFFGTDDKALDEFLDAYHDAGIAMIKRKAVVTPTNLGWTLYELAEELGREC